jgi:hypothetical protein
MVPPTQTPVAQAAPVADTLPLTHAWKPSASHAPAAPTEQTLSPHTGSAEPVGVWQICSTPVAVG